MRHIAFIQDDNGYRHIGFDINNDNVIFTALVDDLGNDIEHYYKYNDHYTTIDGIKIVFDAHCVWFTEKESNEFLAAAISGIDNIEWCTNIPPILPPL